MDIHIGQIIQKEVERQGIPIEVFAKRINRERTTVYGIFGRQWVDTVLVDLISKALKKNIFELIAKEMDETLKQEAAKNTGEGEYLDSVDRTRRWFEKEYPDHLLFCHENFYTRDEIKEVLTDFFKNTTVKPLLIIEVGYTFCCAEVVRQAAQEIYGTNGCAVCPKDLSNVVRLRSLPKRAFVDYVDKNSYGSEEGVEQRLSSVYQAQQDMKKHIVCILHVETEYEKFAAFSLWKDQFFITEYVWNRKSLLSWAIDSGQHQKLIDYIRYCKETSCLGKDYGVPTDYPTRHAYNQQDFEFVTYCLDHNMNINPLVNRHRPISFAEEVSRFDKDYKPSPGYEPLPVTRTLNMDLDINGEEFSESIGLSVDEAAVLIYLYKQAVKGPLKDLDEDGINEQFFPWLQENHPELADSIISHTEKELTSRLNVGDFNETGPYREYLYCIPPSSPDDGWCLDEGNEYKFYLGDLPERIV
jgi:hypothetical protein